MVSGPANTEGNLTQILNSPVLETKLYGVEFSTCGPVTERLLQSVCSGFPPHCPEPQF